MKTRILSMLLCLVLILSVALAAGCSSNETPKLPDGIETVDTVLGEGANTFYLAVIDGEGKETVYEIHTDATIVGQALLELGVIDGDEGDFGLYVKEVGGIVADYDVDGTYWAFYINGEYGMTGVDVTTIAEGDYYALKAEE